MPEESYQVQLEVFEGPLDLLLQLIERERLDITAISLAQVADQFLAYVRSLEQVEADTLADFLMVAVKLVWIKSRLLLPQPAATSEEEEEDPAEALARQLREYKRFKEIAAALKELEERGLHTFPRVAPPPELEKRLEADAGLLDDLLAAARTALLDAPPAAGPEIPGGLVVPFTLTIADQMNHIRRTTVENRRVTFRDLLTSAPHRIEIIVTLLAILELIKRGHVQVVQEEAFGEIMIEGLGTSGADLDETDADDPDAL